MIPVLVGIGLITYLVCKKKRKTVNELAKERAINIIKQAKKDKRNEEIEFKAMQILDVKNRAYLLNEIMKSSDVDYEYYWNL